MKHTYIHTDRQTDILHTYGDTQGNTEFVKHFQIKTEHREVLPNTATTCMLFTGPQESCSKIENYINKSGRIICARSRGRCSSKIKHNY